MLLRGKRDSHIDPPTPSNAIMQRATPYCGENSEPGRRTMESLTSDPELENSHDSEQTLAKTSNGGSKVAISGSWGETL